MSLSSLAYVSSAVHKLDDEELSELLVDARAFNAREGVTGGLLHHDGSFFQYIEGPPEGLQRVYERIRHSNKHKGMIELFHHDIESRVFSVWHMGFAEAPRTLLQQLANAQWLSALPSLQASPSQSDGLAFLLSFWSSVDRRVPQCGLTLPSGMSTSGLRPIAVAPHVER